jgi:hypothetical protein
MKVEIKIPMLSLGGSKTSKDTVKDKDRSKRKEVESSIMQSPVYKPPTKAQMHKESVHGAVRESTRKWVAGEKSTKQHQETLDRAKMALKMGHSGKA